MEEIIQKHVDKQDNLEERVYDEIDAIFGRINVSEVIKDPRAAAEAIRQEVSDVLAAYADQAVNNGIEVAEQFRKLEKRGKTIPIEEAEDGDQNEP